MKKLLIFLLLTLSGAQAMVAQESKSTAPASNSDNDQEIRKATEVLTEKYGLNADQSKQMYTIQQRKSKIWLKLPATKLPIRHFTAQKFKMCKKAPCSISAYPAY